MIRSVRGNLADGTQFEIVNVPLLPNDGFFMNVQIAVNGIPCWPFNVPVQAVRSCHNEEERMELLVRYAQTMVEIYGDVRNPYKYVDCMKSSLRDLCC